MKLTFNFAQLDPKVVKHLDKLRYGWSIIIPHPNAPKKYIGHISADLIDYEPEGIFWKRYILKKL